MTGRRSARASASRQVGLAVRAGESATSFGSILVWRYILDYLGCALLAVRPKPATDCLRQRGSQQKRQLFERYREAAETGSSSEQYRPSFIIWSAASALSDVLAAPPRSSHRFGAYFVYTTLHTLHSFAKVLVYGILPATTS